MMIAHHSKKYIDPATGEDCTRHTRYFIRKAEPEDYNGTMSVCLD
jgi:hypothetical protein